MSAADSLSENSLDARSPTPSTDVDEYGAQEYGLATIGVRAGQSRSPEGEHNDPIFTTSSFVFESAAQAKSRFVDDAEGNVYSRFTNPTVRTFEERLAALEGGRHGTGTASGMAAILSVGLTTLKAGDHVVASSSLFGSTVTLLKKTFARFGVTTTFVPLSDLEAWRNAITPNTRLLYAETPSNPLCELCDIEALSELAKSSGALLAIDNCFCTPVLQRPLEFGADIVIHSATKFLDGQGRCVGGAIVHNSDELKDELVGFMRSAGPAMSPFNAWVFLKGLETLKIRMREHCASTQTLAEWLVLHPAVAKVHYPGLLDHPQHDLAVKQQSGFGGVLSFEVKGSRDDAWTVVDNTKIISITANLDRKSVV